MIIVPNKLVIKYPHFFSNNPPIEPPKALDKLKIKPKKYP